jgi:hypothetical protein
MKINFFKNTYFCYDFLDFGSMEELFKKDNSYTLVYVHCYYGSSFIGFLYYLTYYEM